MLGATGKPIRRPRRISLAESRRGRNGMRRAGEGDTTGPPERRRAGLARNSGMRLVSRITRITVALSLALTAAFSAATAAAFSGHSSKTSTSSSRSTRTNGSGGTPDTTSKRPLVALPPPVRNRLVPPVVQPENPQPNPQPAQQPNPPAPVQQPKVTSGGS